MSSSPLAHPCVHLATFQEQTRDPEYLACNAGSGEPCRWASHHDGLPQPLFHAERLEAAAFSGQQAVPDPVAFQDLVLGTGLV